MTPIQTILEYLQTAEVKDDSGNVVFSGVNSTWQDSQGNTHPAPFVQTRRFDETAKGISSSGRIFFFKSLGGSADRYSSDPVFSFSILGFADDNDAILEDYANLVYSALSDFEHADCIVGIDPISPVAGSYPMASGRNRYDFEYKVVVDSGHFGAGKR